MADPRRMRLSVQPLGRKGKHIMSILISILLASIMLLTVVLLAWSYPGKPKPFLDGNGNLLADSLSEKVFININGVEQGMFIKSKDTSNPVLLYLHGGMPDYFLTERYPTGLENDFTMVWWEQRGAGLSYDSKLPPVTAKQLISDTLEVTNYLRQRFGKEKIYLMGHSGGTFIGIQAAKQAPELYHAYIGVAQISNQLKSEQLAYDYMLKTFRANGNVNMVRKMEAAPVTGAGIPDSYYALRDVAMHSLGVGTTREIRSVLNGIVIASWRSPEYTLMEKFNTWRAKAVSGVGSVWETVLATDLSETVTEIDVPVYFMHGTHDYTCSYTEAKAYFEKLKVPVKGFYTFEDSAHSPFFEEPEKMQKIIREDVLTGTNGLADGGEP